MKIAIITPGSEPSLQGLVTGNEVTARRWEEVLRKLGHDPVVLEQYGNEEADLLIALHARKSSASIEAFKESFPAKPLVVAMTGTDLYQDLPDDETVLRSLEIATHIVVLQPGGLDILNASLRPKTIVIYQSAQPIVRTITKAANCFQACLVAHLRDVKDPLLAAEAASMLPKASRVQVVHAGAAGSSEMEKRAKDAATKNARYRWIGPVPHEEARLLIARSHILLLTSHSEGGANVLSEALALGTPILASRVPGVEGLLGGYFPGYFPAGDAGSLATLLERAEHDEVFYRRLELAGEKLAAMVAPSRELHSWQQLLDSMA